MRAVDLMSGILNTAIAASIATLTYFSHVDEVRAAENEQLICMAQNIYFESRSETMEGMVAVAFVTLNRVENRQWQIGRAHV